MYCFGIFSNKLDLKPETLFFFILTGLSNWVPSILSRQLEFVHVVTLYLHGQLRLLFRMTILILLLRPCTIKLFTDLRNKVECLSLASLSSLVFCFWIRPGAYTKRCLIQVGSRIPANIRLGWKG